MKTILLILSLILSHITYSMNQQLSALSKEEIALNNIKQNPHLLGQIAQYPRIEKARLYALFQHNGMEHLLQPYISKKNSLIQLTRSMRDAGMPTESLDLYHAGLIYTHDQEFEKARECFAASSEPEAYYMQAKLLLDASQDDATLESAQSLLEVSHQRGYAKAGQALDKLKQHKEALQSASLITSLEQSPSVEQSALELHHSCNTVVEEHYIDRFLSKPISKSSIKKLMKSWVDDDSRAPIKRIITADAVKQSPHFAYVIELLLERVISRTQLDALLLCDIIEAVESTAKKDTSLMHKEHIMKLISTPAWSKLFDISTRSADVHMSLLLAIEAIGFYYRAPQLLDHCIALYQSYESLDQTITPSESLTGKVYQALTDLYLVQAALYQQAKEIEKTVYCFEQAAARDPRYFWEVGSYLSNIIENIPEEKKQAMLEKAISALVNYADNVAIIPSDRLAQIVKFTGCGIDVAGSSAYVGPRHEKTISYAQRLLDQVEEDLAILENYSATEEATCMKLRLYCNQAALALIRSTSALDQNDSDAQHWLTMLMQNHSPLTMNAAIIFFNTSRWELARTAFTSIVQDGYITEQKELDFARYMLGLIDFNENQIDLGLSHFSQIENLDIMKIRLENSAVILRAVETLTQTVQNIIARNEQDLTVEDLVTCTMLGKIVLANKSNTEFLPHISTALKGLMFAAKHGSLESQLTIWMHSGKTQFEVWQKEFNQLVDMLSKFAKREYPLFSKDSDETIALYTKRVATYLLQLNSEHHAMLAYVAPLYAHDYLQLLHIMQSMGVIEQFSCMNTSYIIQNQGYSAFCTFLKTFADRLAQNIHALSPADLADLQSAVFLYWNMELMHTDDKVEKKEWLSNKINDVYLHATALREKIPFTQAMTDFYEYITLEYLADNETIPLAQWNSTVESLVTTSSNKTHVVCGLTMVCKRAKDKQKQQHLTLLCNYLASNFVKGLHHTSALLERQLYHLFVDMTDRGDLVNLKKILSYVADKEHFPDEYGLYEIIELHLSKKRSSEDQRTFKAMIKATGIVLINQCLARLAKRIVKL